MKSYATRWALRRGMDLYLLLLALARRLGPRRRPTGAGEHILLTLNFHAAGWPKALLGPLVRAPRGARLTLVTTAEVRGLDCVRVIHPPRWLRALAGSTVARLLTFAAVALRERPSIVGGVHLLLNGLTAAIVAALSGARSLYVCVGGPNEVAGGGILSENRLFARLTSPDAAIERRLIEAARGFDLIVAMGTSGAAFFARHGARGTVAVIPSGVDTVQRPPAAAGRDVDVILVARLVPLKRIDLFIGAVAHVARQVPSVRAVIIGSGPMLEPGRAQVRALGVGRQVHFLGHAPDVFSWLARAKVFLLPSDTEGVSISLIEAMMCGAVPVVSDVGDLGDVVQPGISGVLVRERTASAFGAPIVDLLRHEARREQLSAAAVRAAEAFTPATLAARWDALLSGAGDGAWGKERNGAA
jgi:glycosyltransferase involved in cell wall biosynthesis